MLCHPFSSIEGILEFFLPMFFVPTLLGFEVEALHIIAVVVLHLKGVHGKDALRLLQGITDNHLVLVHVVLLNVKHFSRSIHRVDKCRWYATLRGMAAVVLIRQPGEEQTLDEGSEDAR